MLAQQQRQQQYNFGFKFPRNIKIRFRAPKKWSIKNKGLLANLAQRAVELTEKLFFLRKIHFCNNFLPPLIIVPALQTPKFSFTRQVRGAFVQNSEQLSEKPLFYNNHCQHSWPWDGCFGRTWENKIMKNYPK